MEKQIGKILIVDGNNYLYRAWHKFKNMQNKAGKGTSIIYGVPLMVNTLINNFKPDLVLFVIDGHRSKHRLEILPGYKEGRKKVGYDPTDFHEQKFELMSFLQYGLGIPVIYDEHQECDDVIYALVKKLRKKSKEIIICSADKDFNQLVKKNIKIWNHTAELLFDEKNMRANLPYQPSQCVDYLTLIGDDSDKIPGYRGIGEKKAEEILLKYSSLKVFIKSEEEYKGVDKVKLAELMDKAKILINLKTYYKLFNKGLKFKTYQGKPTNFNHEFIADFCITYGLNTFRMPTWSNKFKELWKKRKSTSVDHLA